MQELSNLFYKNGEIDYETLLDTLAKIKQKIDGERDGSAIDVYIESIRTGNPYLHVSNASSEIFKRLCHDIETKDYDKASSDLNLLYEKSVETESQLKRRGKVEFRVSIAIALSGIIISCITSLKK